MHVLVRSREIVLFRVYSYFPCRPELILAKVDVWLYLQLFQIQKEKRGAKRLVCAHTTVTQACDSVSIPAYQRPAVS
jgi:hypothetical protein